MRYPVLKTLRDHAKRDRKGGLLQALGCRKVVVNLIAIKKTDRDPPIKQ